MDKYTLFVEAVNMLLAEHFWKLAFLFGMAGFFMLAGIVAWRLPQIIEAKKSKQIVEAEKCRDCRNTPAGSSL